MIYHISYDIWYIIWYIIFIAMKIWRWATFQLFGTSPDVTLHSSPENYTNTTYTHPLWWWWIIDPFLGRKQPGQLNPSPWPISPFNDASDDDIYIMVKCLCVSKSHHFCIQRIWSFLMFIDTFPFSKVSGNRRNDQIPWKNHFLSRDLVVSHVYRHLSLFRSVWKPKKRPNPLKRSLFSKDLVVSHVCRHLSLFKRVWKPKKWPNPLKKSFFSKGFGCFSCL